jgi:hypothetical protein
VITVWWLWIMTGLAIWLAVGLLFALLIGRGIRMADQRSPGTGSSAPLTTADLVPSPGPAPVTRRRSVPLPPVGIALAALAVALETTGYVLRLTGGTGPAAQMLSMDAPFSIPRLFVASLFAVAAFAAVAGAGVQPGRRSWWVAVALVAGAIAVVKAGSTVHAEVFRGLAEMVGRSTAHLISALLATGIVATLWSLSRDERRDRRRVLSALSLYAVAAVGLSALTGVVSGAFGHASSWAAAAAFVEEAGEALAGVSYLVAVLVGVAPSLVLPATWTLRRRADADGLTMPERVPGSSVTGRVTGL